MKVVIDDKIPYLRPVMERLDWQAVYLPGKEIDADAVRDADAVLVRTRTRCNRELLEGSRVRFIGTATIGFDHIDTEYCRQAGITWSNCPGCNAGAVEQYVHSALLALQQDKGLQLQDCTIGVVGVGHVGSRICRLAESLGMRVLRNDPPRAAQGEEGFCSLDELARECKVISFHTPLVRGGACPTYHLADSRFFGLLRHCPYIINTSRGEVVDNEALLRALGDGQVAEAVMDVWEHEPDISLRLLEKSYIATPHIAGYSVDGKANATRMTLEAFCRFFHLDADCSICLPDSVQKGEANKSIRHQLQLYDPRRDTRLLKACPENFEELRANYPLRHEQA